MNEVDRHVGARVRELRLARDMTEQSVAKALGISTDEYLARESASSRIGAAELFALAKLFDVDFGAFFH